MSTLQALREATKPDHQALDAHPFFDALDTGELSWDGLAGFLHTMAVLHHGIERAATHSDERRLRAVWRPELGRAGRAAHDVETLLDPASPVAVEALVQALKVGRELREAAQDQPVTLLGALYVLVGSSRGAPLVARRAQRAFPQQLVAGSAYWAPAHPSGWQDFATRLDAVSLNEDELEGVVGAARQLFAGVGSALDHLHPLSTDALATHSAALNPEAGAHPVAADPVVLAAALTAARQTWDAFPYFQARYGERGARFSRSDSGWLATLGDLSPDERRRQVRWLAGVLAARGMPSMLLEHQLRALADVLTHARPQQASAWQTLSEAADQLAAPRDAHLSAALRRAQNTVFLAAAGDEGLPHAGLLIPCAVADEAAGLTDAEGATCQWLADPGRFSPGWCVAVTDARRAARTHLSEK